MLRMMIDCCLEDGNLFWVLFWVEIYLVSALGWLGWLGWVGLGWVGLVGSWDGVFGFGKGGKGHISPVPCTPTLGRSVVGLFAYLSVGGFFVTTYCEDIYLWSGRTALPGGGLFRLWPWACDVEWCCSYVCT